MSKPTSIYFNKQKIAEFLAEDTLAVGSEIILQGVMLCVTCIIWCHGYAEAVIVQAKGAV